MVSVYPRTHTHTHTHTHTVHVFEQRARDPKIRLCLIKASLAITIYGPIVAICSKLACISLLCVCLCVCVCVCVCLYVYVM